MNPDNAELLRLAQTFADALGRADAAGFAAAFSNDALYDDVFYGRFEGRAAIEAMIRERWLVDGTDFEWQMFEPVSDGRIGYVNWVFSFTSRKHAERRAVMVGASRLIVADGLIRDYREWCYEDAALAGIGVPAEALHKRSLKRDHQLREAVADRPRHRF